ncbi:MAG: glycerol-3-phosphate acyltransferase [Gammaproteobacteria bacterium]|jgi:glycerol-3-phosphate acyltransferase PlsY|nr:glycerol-3-phosphate acyltransferase [Gammaproteobacteria bacterium]
MLELGLKVLVSYLAGSINGALLLGALLGLEDVRRTGSGNAGATNAMRAHGKWFAAGVMVFDVLKGALPVLVLPELAVAGIAADPLVTREWLAYACAGAAVFGHCYPVWHDFAGGKGFATAIGALGAVLPGVLLPLAAAWAAGLLVFGYVGMATVLAAAAVPLYLSLTGTPGNLNAIACTAALAAFIAYTHRSNLRAFLTGNYRPDLAFSLFRRTR